MPKYPMMKAKSKKKESSEEIEESEEDIEDDSNIEEYDSEEGASEEENEGGVREVNKEHLLNYESDDSDEAIEESSQEFANKVRKEKEELTANDTWGRKK